MAARAIDDKIEDRRVPVTSINGALAEGISSEEDDD